MPGTESDGTSVTVSTDTGQGKTFTQAEIDAIVENRLIRERKAWDKANSASVSAQEKQELEDLRKAKAEEAEKRARAEGDWQRLEKSLREDFETKLKGESEKRTRAEEILRQEKIRKALVSAAAKRGAIDAEEVADLLEKRVTLDEDYQEQVLEKPNGNRAYVGGAPMSVEQLVDGYLSQKPHLVRSGNPGGGAGSRGGASTSTEGSARHGSAKLRELEQELEETKKKAASGDNGALARILQINRQIKAEQAQKTA